MITVRTGAWTKSDKVFLAEVLDAGLRKNCYAYNMTGVSPECAECSHNISCKDMQSAYHHILAVLLRDEAKSLNQENKTL